MLGFLKFKDSRKDSRKKGFRKLGADIFSLFSSSLLGQLVHIVALPYLSAYFSPVEIGAFFFFQALVVMGSIFVSLQSEQAIVVESNDNSYVCFKKSILIIALFSFLAYVVSSQVPDMLAFISKKSTVSDWIGYLPIALFILGSNNAIEYLLTYEKKFRLISFIRVARPVAIYLSIISLKIFAGNLNNLLILGFIYGNGIILIYQVLILSRNKMCRYKKVDFSLAGFRNYYRKHKNILIFNTMSSGIVTASMQLPYVFISTVYGDSFSAFYGMAMRIIGMPLSLLGQSFGQVYFQKFSHIFYYKHSIYPFVKRLMYKTYLLGILPLFILLLFTPDIFQLFLGNGWDKAAQLSRILLPWLFVLMVSAPVSRSISVLGVQRKTIFYDLALFSFRILGLYMCWLLKLDFIFTMAIFSGIGVVFNVLFQFIILYFSKITRPSLQ